MANQIDSYGFQDLRTYAQNNWNHIAVLDSNGNELLRWDVDGNANTSWESGPSNNPLTARLEITGSDIQSAGNSLPVTVSETEAYKSQSATTRVGHDTFVDAEMQVPNDELIILHRYRLPP